MEFNSKRKAFIQVRNKEHSALIQKMLFAAGIEWVYDGKNILFTEFPFLVINNNTLYTGINAEPLHKHGYEEINMDWLVPEEEKRETIEIPGVGYYYKDELMERLSSLKEAE